MKIKNDFVTNSSSASYIIKKDDITALQEFMIDHHVEISRMMGSYDVDDKYGSGWKISKEFDQIELSTSMDNFNMLRYLQTIGVDVSKITKWHS